MKAIICCALLLAVAAQCYGESRISVENSNYTTHFDIEDSRVLKITPGEDGQWQVQSSDPDPQISYSSRVNKEVFSSDPQRTYSYQQHEDRTEVPVRPVQTTRHRRPSYDVNQVTEQAVPEQRRTNQPSYSRNQHSYPRNHPSYPRNQHSYRRNPPTTTTDYPRTHRVSEFPTQQGERPRNMDTVVKLVDDNSNVIVYNTNGRQIFHETQTLHRDDSSDSRHYGAKTSQSAPVFRPTPRYQPKPTYYQTDTRIPTYHQTVYHQPETRIPTYGYSYNDGVFVSQSVNTGGPYPSQVQHTVHVPNHYY